MSNKKIDIAQIRKYLNGELDARAMFELEREAHNDPFLWDTIKGMEAGTEDHQPNLDAIDQLIKERIGKDERRAVPLWKTWPVAASLIIALGIGGWLLIHRSEQPIVVVQTPKLKPADRNTQTDKFKPEPAPALNRVLPAPKPALVAALNHKQVNGPVLKPELTEQQDREGVKVDTASNYIAVAVPPKTHKDSGMFLQQVNIASRAYVNKKSSPMSSSATISSVESDVKDKTAQADSTFTHVLLGKVAGVNITTTKSELAKYFPGLVVTGKITDGNDHSPLPGVSIRAKGTNATTQTGADGTFKISVPNKGETLDVVYVGYQTKQVKVKDRDSLNIALNASNQSLAEVVIGYGTAVKPDVAEPQPKTGWKAYNKYLKDNATMPDGQTGTIKLTLTVGIDGGISNIKIVKGLSDEMNKKAIQLINNGPGWVKQSDGKPAEVKVKIEFHQ